MIEYHIKKPSLEEYRFLRNLVNWDLGERGISDARAADSLDRSPLCVCAYEKEQIVGMVRVSGDLSMYGYIQDTIVHPAYQGQRIGSNMMKKILEALSDKRGYLLGVCPSRVSVDFYQGLGFKKRPENPNGFMSLEIN